MLETSVCVALIRGRAAEARLPEASGCVLSVITLAELEVGVRRSVRPAAQRKAVEAFTGIFEVLPWDLKTTGYYGDLRVDLEKRGLVIGPLDMLIAAHALRLGATLVTANFREFQRVVNLPCLEWR
jgi:tRNA(fMet)-specific endonuclease VapC